MRNRPRKDSLFAAGLLLGCASSSGGPTAGASAGASGYGGVLPAGGVSPSGGSTGVAETGGLGGSSSGGASAAAGAGEGAGAIAGVSAAALGQDGGVPRAASSDAGTAPDANPGILAATPPMGWNSWNAFACNIDEARIKAAADALASNGMKDVGYQYVNVDDCWMNGRDAAGNIRWDTTKFPSGIAELANYVHGKGLKFGIYSTPNTGTCEGLYGNPALGAAYVGSLGREQQDATSYASWGVDLLKYDDCGGPLSAFVTMRDALRATNHPILYSINPYTGNTCVPTGARTSTCGLDLADIAHMWRISADIKATWGDVTRIIDIEAPLSAYAGPGHWNDPDMLEVGNGSLTEDENRAHFSMWAMFAAPLIAGNDLTTMTEATKAILTNAEVIAVDQDPLGNQARVVATPQPGLQVWSKTLSGDNVRAVALFNRNAGAASITVEFADVGLSAGQVAVRDLWQKADLGSLSGSYTATSVPSHGVVMLRLSE
jgi:alpha-galactosidase